MIITKEYLRSHTNEIFVFGDNDARFGKKGAAELRDEPNTYGFVTKKYPSNDNGSFYIPEDYGPKLNAEIRALSHQIRTFPEKTFLISELGGGLANKFGIRPMIVKALEESGITEMKNVRML